MAEKIVIDAGHNGLTDPGAVYSGRRESDDVLALARALGDILSGYGYEIDYTRTGDINQSVTQKAQYANDADADLFISLHRNKASYPGQYDGVQTLIYDTGGIKPLMAEAVNSNLEQVGYKNINVETRPDLAVLRRTEMPALLVEVGFIDSEKDNRLFDTRFQETAQAIANGIVETLQGDTGSRNAVQPAEAAPDYRQYASLTTPPGPGPDPDMAPDPMPPFRPDAPLPPQSPPYPPQPMPPASGTSPAGDKSPTGSRPSAGDRPRPLYRVQVGAFYDLQNAVALEQELKQLGYNTWIVTV